MKNFLFQKRSLYDSAIIGGCIGILIALIVVSGISVLTALDAIEKAPDYASVTAKVRSAIIESILGSVCMLPFFGSTLSAVGVACGVAWNLFLEHKFPSSEDNS